MHPVEQQKLAGAARAVIDDFLALPIGARPSCPYFNNRRKRIRGSLRVVKGKGTPEEIALECFIEAKLARVKIAELSTDKLKEFLVSNDLGIDCSGFVYHVLDTFCREKTGRSLEHFVKHLRTGFPGRLIGRLRPAENIGVMAFASDKNSKPIEVSEAKPGDIVVFLGTGRDNLYNHILVITAVEKIKNGDRNNQENTRVSYAHSYTWPSDGTLGHGVREGEILVHGDDLLGGTWKEKGVTGNDNYTYLSAKNAKEVSVRRLGFLN